MPVHTPVDRLRRATYEQFLPKYTVTSSRNPGIRRRKLEMNRLEKNLNRPAGTRINSVGQYENNTFANQYNNKFGHHYYGKDEFKGIGQFNCDFKAGQGFPYYGHQLGDYDPRIQRIIDPNNITRIYGETWFPYHDNWEKAIQANYDRYL